MAQGKKSFIAYADWKGVFDELPNEDAGILIKHIFAYVNDENPVSDSLLIRAVFANIKTTLKRDLHKYEIIREKRSLAGKASADKRQQVLTSVESVDNVLRVSVNDNVSVSDSVNDNDNEKKEKKIKYADFVSLLPDEYKKLIVDHGKDNTKTLIEILNNYKGSTGKRYKSDYMTILNWVIEKAKKDHKYIGQDNDDLEYKLLKEKLYGKPV